MSDDRYEAGYQAGQRILLTNQLRAIVGQLGVDDPEAEKAKWLIERGEVIAMLRYVCHCHGDNDWPDTLNLSDIIDKHLFRHLDVQ